jgi:hypothetical protein
LGAGSLILILGVFLLVTFLSFWAVGGVAAALCLPARVLEDPALGPFDNAPADSALGVRAGRGTTEIGVSPSTHGIGTMKLSKVCDQTYKHEYLKKIDGLS